MLNKPYDLSLVADTLVLWDTQAPQPQGDTVPSFQTGEVKPGFLLDASGRTVSNSAPTVLAVPPAGGGALNWGAAWLSFGCDFGSVKLRVAVHNGGWSVQELTVTDSGQRTGFQLPNNAGKVSIGRVAQTAGDTADSVPCSWLLEYGA